MPRIALYGISRVDDPVHRTKAWRVSLRRRGVLLVKNFPDKTYGGSGKALAAAKKHRDRIKKQYPPLLRAEFADSPRRNNTSGVTGVCLIANTVVLASGKKRQYLYWEAIWPTRPGQHENRRFSVASHGNERAFAMACQARAEGLARLEGIFWASQRGNR